MPAHALNDTTEDARHAVRLAETRQWLDEDVGNEVAKLSDGWDGRLFPDHPLTILAARITRSLVEAGFVLHDCAARQRTGGVCVNPSTHSGGVIVTWTVHDILAQDPTRAGHNVGVHEVMNYALADVLRELGWTVDDFGQVGAHIVALPGDPKLSRDRVRRPAAGPARRALRPGPSGVRHRRAT